MESFCPQFVTFGVFDLSTKMGSGHLVGLVANDQVPSGFRGRQLVLDIFVTAEFVQARDDQILFEKPIPGSSRFEFVVGKNVEGQAEAPVKFVLPLLSKTRGADDEASLQVAA